MNPTRYTRIKNTITPPMAMSHVSRAKRHFGRILTFPCLMAKNTPSLTFIEFSCTSSIKNLPTLYITAFFRPSFAVRPFPVGGEPPLSIPGSSKFQRFPYNPCFQSNKGSGDRDSAVRYHPKTFRAFLLFPAAGRRHPPFLLQPDAETKYRCKTAIKRRGLFS